MIRITTTLTRVASTQRAISNWRVKLPQAINQQTKLQALRLKRIITQGIRDGAPGGKEFKPLAESTKKMKGSSKPLIDNGDLVRSINVDNVGHDGFFVGVNRNAQTSDDEPMVNLAEIHENGTPPYAIPVTPKLRAFWNYMVHKGVFSSPLGPDKHVILHPGVPARPFLKPSFEEWEKDAERQFEDGLAKALGVGRV